MNFVFHPDAEVELFAAIDWYEERTTGLGADFADEIYATVTRAASMPLAWPRIDGEVRRVLANRFPYGVLYAPRDDSIYVLAVMHLSRHPTFWKDRA